MSAVTLGLDLGTTGVRVVAIDATGALLLEANRGYPLRTPHPGWTEQDPADWVAATLDALAEVATRLGDERPVALGLSGQMHGMVALDATGAVVRPAPLWNDQRTGDAVKAIEERVGRAELIRRTGNPAITGFQLPKVVWLRAAEPEAFARTRQVLLPKDYLGFVLTGAMATEPSDASGVGCLNLARRDWDDEILAALDLSRDLFPRVAASDEVIGHLSAPMALATGLPLGLPVVAGGGDNAAAAIGLGLSSARMGFGSVSLGTSGVIFAPLDAPTPDPLGRAHLFCHADGGYHLLGVTLAAGGSLRWCRDVLAPNATYDALMAEASTVAPGSGGVTFLPYLAGERTPHLDPDARGAWVGLSLAHGRAHLVRAVLEGVAFSLRDALDVMQPITPLFELFATGGGARSPLWRGIVADVLGVRLQKPRREEGAAYGAALLALANSGAAGSLQDVLALAPRDGEAVKPNHEPAYAGALARYRDLYPALKGS